MVTILGIALSSTDLYSNSQLGLVIFILFIGSSFYTYHSWAKEDAELGELEIKCVHETIKNEISGMLSEVQREKTLGIKRGLDKIKNETSRTIDSHMQEMCKRLTEDSEKSRSRSQTNLRNIDIRLHDLQGMNQQISRLQQQSQELIKLSSKQLRETIGNINRELK